MWDIWLSLKKLLFLGSHFSHRYGILGWALNIQLAHLKEISFIVKPGPEVLTNLKKKYENMQCLSLNSEAEA